jgi:thiamine-phosphate pyrophosphorylase
MTDERMGDALWDALERLPRGSGIVFRHYRAADRRRLFERVRVIARRRRLVLLLAGTPREAIGWRADGVHGRSARFHASRSLLCTAAVHHARELARAHSDAVFLSPVFATRSHPGAEAMGPVRFGLMAHRSRVRVIALGGMDARRYRRLKRLGAYGWAGIDALIDQNLKVVPR